jgi:hypothetical protein
MYDDLELNVAYTKSQLHKIQYRLKMENFGNWILRKLDDKTRSEFCSSSVINYMKLLVYIFENTVEEKDDSINIVFKNSNIAFNESQNIVAQRLINLGPFNSREEQINFINCFLENIPKFYAHLLKEEDVPDVLKK